MAEEATPGNPIVKKKRGPGRPRTKRGPGRPPKSGRTSKPKGLLGRLVAVHVKAALRGERAKLRAEVAGLVQKQVKKVLKAAFR